MNIHKIFRGFILFSFFINGCSGNGFSPPYVYGDKIAIEGSYFNVQYRVDGDSISSIYVYPVTNLTKDWVIKRDYSKDLYYLLTPDDSLDQVGVLFFDAEGVQEILVEKVPEEINEKLLAKKNITDYVVTILENE